MIDRQQRQRLLHAAVVLQLLGGAVAVEQAVVDVQQQGRLGIALQQRRRSHLLAPQRQQGGEQLAEPAGQPCGGLAGQHQQQQARLAGDQLQRQRHAVTDAGAAQAPGQPAAGQALQLRHAQLAGAGQLREQFGVAGPRRIARPRRQAPGAAALGIGAGRRLPGQIVGLPHLRPAQGQAQQRIGQFVARRPRAGQAQQLEQLPRGSRPAAVHRLRSVHDPSG
ncbi:hypothetical protein D3C78_961470 [compost metagenome]